MAVNGRKRDVTAVRSILANASPLSVKHGKVAVSYRIISFDDWRRALDILTKIDARTGRRDPTQRRPYLLTWTKAAIAKATKKPAKRGRPKGKR